MSPTLEAVLIIGICLTLIVMVYMVVKISKALDSVQKNISELTDSFSKAVDDIGEIKDQAITSMQQIDKAANEFNSVTKDVQIKLDQIVQVFDPMKSLVDVIYGKCYTPVKQLASVVSAGSKAVNVFIDKLTKK